MQKLREKKYARLWIIVKWVCIQQIKSLLEFLYSFDCKTKIGSVSFHQPVNTMSSKRGVNGTKTNDHRTKNPPMMQFFFMPRHDMPYRIPFLLTALFPRFFFISQFCEHEIYRMYKCEKLEMVCCGWATLMSLINSKIAIIWTGPHARVIRKKMACQAV